MSHRPLLYISLAALALALLGVGLAFVASGGAGGDGEEVESEADRLRAEFEARDARQIERLTSDARRAREDLAPVLEGMSESAPPGKRPSGWLPGAEEVSGWQRAAEEAEAAFGEAQSGETGTNVARGSLVSAVNLLQSSATAYERAREMPTGERSEMLEQAASERDIAVRVWSVGATQLDSVNVETGNGHQHVYLPADGVGSALTADPAPEGSGAREDHEHEGARDR